MDNPFNVIQRDGVDVATMFRSGVHRGRDDSGGVAEMRADGSEDALKPSPLGEQAHALVPGRPAGRQAPRRGLARGVLGRIRRFLLAPLEADIRAIRRDIEELRKAAPRIAISTQDGNVLVRTDVGYVLCTLSDVGTLAYLIEAGGIEHGTRLVIQRVLGPGDVFVDVGANLGLHTLAAARAIRATGRIHAFEPYGPTAALLRETLKINAVDHLVQVHEVAASNRTGRQPLYLGNFSGLNSLFPLAQSDQAGAKAVDVSLVRLDDALSDDPPPALIKIDVEGAELAVLEGARSTIERSPDVMLIVEFGPSHLVRAGQSVASWFAKFESMGLVFRVIGDDGTLKEWTIGADHGSSINLLFARPEARSWIRAEAG